MSYEGYEEYLCKNGHHWTRDCYMAGDDERCPRCGEPQAWNHSVDQTNGFLYDEKGQPCSETFPYQLEVDRYEEIEVPAHIERRPIYKIPEKT